jgi:hypothetical protein
VSPAEQGQRLFPRSDHSGQEYQQQSIRLPADGSFHLSTQDDQLVAQQRVFHQQFGFPSGQIDKSADEKGGRRWLDPTQETFLERRQAKTNVPLHREKYTEHDWNLFFVKMDARSERTCSMDRVDYTHISRALTRKLAPSNAAGRFLERIFQVVSTTSKSTTIARGGISLLDTSVPSSMNKGGMQGVEANVRHNTFIRV